MVFAFLADVFENWHIRFLLTGYTKRPYALYSTDRIPTARVGCYRVYRKFELPNKL